MSKTVDIMYSEAELRAIEEQLSCPSGEEGKAMGHRMNERNRSMIIETVVALELQSSDKILELGMGNAGHLKLLHQQASDLHYTGLEVSLTMLREAEHQKRELSLPEHTQFGLYNGEDILFPAASFDKVLSINTIYFWDQPIVLLQEIRRVLSPNRVIAITFAHKSFMSQLPFVGDRFQLYEPPDLRQLIAQAGLSVREERTKEEVVLSKTGERVTRTYSVFLITKE